MKGGGRVVGGFAWLVEHHPIDPLERRRVITEPQGRVEEGRKEVGGSEMDYFPN